VTLSRKDIVYLVDGSSYLYRAYHAIRNLSNSKGFPTNAVFGFTKMVLKLLTERDPSRLGVVFDCKGPTFRHKIFKDYKATRPPMPEDLALQIPVIKRILQNLNIRMIEKEGYEADDIIGTLARSAEEKGFRIVMVTGDKDFRQVITPAASMWDSMKEKVTDYDSLKAEYGIEPEQFIDLMALSGDPSDNVPGVPGVGEKTALSLIKEFGSLEKTLEHAHAVKKNRLRENLQASKEAALLSKRLVTIDRHVPLEEGFEKLETGVPNHEKLAEIFREMEFRDLWDQFAVRGSGQQTYSLCLSKEDLISLAAEIRKEGKVCLDTETTSEDPMRAELVGISFSWEAQRAFYLPVGHRYPNVPGQPAWSHVSPILKTLLEDEGIAKVGQNIKYDAEVFRRSGLDLKGISFDTMVASYVINPGLRQHSLDYLAQHYLNHKMITYEEVVGKGKAAKNFSQVELEKAKEYACEDADITLQLAEILGERLREDKNEDLFYQMEMRLLPVLMDMELTGILIDIPFFEHLSARFERQMRDLEHRIYREAGMEFNINSPQQLGFVLFEKLQLPVQKRTAKNRNYSTDVKVLAKLSAFSYAVPQLVLRYRTLSKLKSTYLDALVKMVDPSTGRIHTSYNQTVAATGRLSSSNPNLQNIPIRGEEGREIRKGFVADKGHYLLSADYSQVELRIFAHYSGDEGFMNAFKRNEDIHTRTASEILEVRPEAVTPEMRRIAKAINFGIIYGMGPQRLSEELGIDLKTAKKHIQAYYEKYKGVARYRDRMIETARKTGYVTTLFNRRRYLPDISHQNRVIRAEAERMAVNTPIQGTAADLIKKAMINIHEKFRESGLRSKMLLQVHDELVFEVPEAEVDQVQSMIKGEMEGVCTLNVPLEVKMKTGRNWDEAH
jgi:DNA polymerase-1